ncbi:MAG: DNA internalization-related competence protein ComEC/Rec2, partial [Mariprofundus sp.]
TQLFWPGDIEAIGEKQLLLTKPAPVSAMLIPHHGSRTSSTAPLLQALRPELAIAQTAAHNRYGFPRPEVVARYRAIDTRVYNSANGAVMVNWPQAHPVATHWSEAPFSRRSMAQQWWQTLSVINIPSLAF